MLSHSLKTMQNANGWFFYHIKSIFLMFLPQSQHFSLPGISKIWLALGLNPRLSGSSSESSQPPPASASGVSVFCVLIVSCNAVEIPC